MEKLEKILVTLSLILFPLIFWPGLISSFETPKLIILSLFALIALIVGALKIIVKGRLNFKTTGLDYSVILLGVIYVISALIKTPNKLEAFYLPGTALIIILGIIYFYLAANLFPESKKLLTTIIFISGVTVAASSLITASGILAGIEWVPSYLKNANFSLIGGKLPETIFLTSLLPLGVALIIEVREVTRKLFWGVCFGVVALSVFLSVYNMLPGKSGTLILPSYKLAWAISVDTLKDSPFFGIGPGNYLTAYNIFRPVGVNATPLWSAKFGTSASFLLTSLTETGIIGFLILLVLLYKIGKIVARYLNPKTHSSPLETGLAISLGLLILSFIFLPFYLTSILFFFLLASTVSAKHEVKVNLTTVNDSPVASRIPALILAAIFLTLLTYLSYLGAKITLAEYDYSQALLAVNANNGKLAYSAIVKAINLNPKADRYHLSLSQMDIALASSIAQNKNITDTDKTTITQLIQEAISEAKNGVSLNPQRSGNWENLAVIYQSIMPFAQGSDNFAIQSYTQAIALDPVNPNLRISLGGIYYALGRFDEAISTFQMATLAKADLANAHYNLAAAFREKNEIAKAITEMNTVISLVPKDSNDAKVAKADLENLQKRLPSASATPETTGESLTAPASAPAPVIKPPLALPEEATPPAATLP